MFSSAAAQLSGLLNSLRVLLEYGSRNSYDKPLMGKASLILLDSFLQKSRPKGDTDAWYTCSNGWSSEVRKGSMDVRHYRQWLLVVPVALILSGIGAMDPSMLAASAKKKEPKQPDAPVAPVTGSPRVLKASRAQSGIQPQGRIDKNLEVEPAKKPADQAGGRARRRFKRSKKQRPQATGHAKPDLSYHGILERPNRYDPRQDHRKRGTPNPHIGDVLHDHFQELDKNHDGAIDPIERAIGRIDLDRDL